LGYEAWGKFRCSVCHGGNFPGAGNASLIMSSMQSVQKHKDAYGPTAISGWNLTVSQEEANNMAVFALSPSSYY
jgi:mono/diheme cytochrome c family protein